MMNLLPMIRELTPDFLPVLLFSEFDVLVFENYGFDLEKKSVILITPFQNQESANQFFDTSKRSYNIIKKKNFLLNELTEKHHLSIYIDIQQFVSVL